MIANRKARNKKRDLSWIDNENLVLSIKDWTKKNWRK